METRSEKPQNRAHETSQRNSGIVTEVPSAYPAKLSGKEKLIKRARSPFFVRTAKGPSRTLGKESVPANRERNPRELTLPLFVLNHRAEKRSFEPDTSPNNVPKKNEKRRQ